MTKYTFVFVAIVLILLPFFVLKEIKEDNESSSPKSKPTSQTELKNKSSQ